MIAFGRFTYLEPIINHIGEPDMTQFQKAIEKVLKAHNQLEWFQTGQDFYLRLDQPNYDRAPRKVLL